MQGYDPTKQSQASSSRFAALLQSRNLEKNFGQALSGNFDLKSNKSGASGFRGLQGLGFGATNLNSSGKEDNNFSRPELELMSL